MLTSLSIQNYALISHLEIDFRKGFSVITGETGAGKSIILGALSLILGQRSDSRSIKEGENKCIIEGVFDISPYDLEVFFAEKEWDYDAVQCIIRREIHTSGKSRAFINDMPVALTDLKDLVSLLIDVHSQHQNLLLGDDRFQLRVLDALSGNIDLFLEYKSTYRQYIVLQKQLNTLKKEAEASRSEEDYLRFQSGQLEEANLKAEEQETLEQEIGTLSHAEEIKGDLFRLNQILSDEERGILTSLKEATSIAQSLQKIYAPAHEMSDRLQTAYIDLNDLMRDIGVLEENLEYDPQRLRVLSERLDLIFSLQQKHRVSSVKELIEIQQLITEKLSAIDHYDVEVGRLETQSDELYSRILSLATQISQIRHEAAQRLETQLKEKVSVLGMPNLCFSCRMEKKAQPDDTGSDQVTFLFSANKNISMMPVSQIASGGEISRLMLGVKALIAGAMALPTIIFDEIDTGISGEIADKTGDIMRELGSVMQVITISHLPQIAAKGDSHYFVYKEENENGTETRIRQLDPEERIKEIARMLSGSELSNAALENAKELLRKKKKEK